LLATKSELSRVCIETDTERIDHMPINPKKVFVIHGRNWRLRGHIMAFLRAIGLSPLSWGEAIKLTNIGAPYIGQALDAALEEAQAVVVLLTGDDEIEPGNLNEDLPYQPRANVLFEAGMAFTRLPSRTILIEFETIRPCSVLAGRHCIRLSNQFAHRKAFISSLQNVGCAINLPGDEIIRNTGDFSII
jgi:predicted nucleotide-binding protein